MNMNLPPKNQTILLPEDHPVVDAFKAIDTTGLPVRHDVMSLDDAYGLLESGAVGVVIAGAAHPSAEVVGGAIKKFNPRRDEQGQESEQGDRQLVSSLMLMEKAGREPIILADCAVNPAPNSEALAEIARQTVENAQKLNIDPVVAFISFSTEGSAGHTKEAQLVQGAVSLFRGTHPEIPTLGEIQWDAATNEEIYYTKTGKRHPEGKHPNVFIFPNLDTGNAMYKALQDPDYGGGWTAVGPLLQGFENGVQVHDLSRGVTPEALKRIVEVAAQLNGISPGPVPPPAPRA